MSIVRENIVVSREVAQNLPIINQATTKLTNFPGTTITFLISLPSI